MHIETVHIVGNGSAGTQDVVASAGFGIPQAALVFSVSSISGPTNVASRMMIGAWAGSVNHGIGLRQDDNVTTMETARSMSSSHMIPFTLAGPDSVSEKMRVTSTITDGVQITWDVSSTSQYDIVLINGLDDVTLGHIELSTTQANNDVVLTHDTNAIFVFGDLASHPTDGVTNNAGLCFGVAHYDGVNTDQACASFFGRDASANAQNGQKLLTDSILAQVTDASDTYKGVFSRLSATTFRIATDNFASTGADTFIYLAMALPDPTAFEMGVDATPTTATNKVIPTAAQRNSMGIVATRLSAIDTWTVNTEAQGISLGTADSQSERSQGFRSQDGAGVAVENCHITSDAFTLMAYNADTFTHAANVTFNASDITLAFSSSEATPRHFIWWAASDTGTGPSVPTLSSPALTSITHESAVMTADVTF